MVYRKNEAEKTSLVPAIIFSNFALISRTSASVALILVFCIRFELFWIYPHVPMLIKMPMMPMNALCLYPYVDKNFKSMGKFLSTDKI